MTRKMIGDRPKAIIYLIITAILWSLWGILIKLVDSNALAIAGTRSAIASLIIWLYLGKPRFNWSAAQIGAALSYTGTVILFVMSNKMTTAPPPSVHSTCICGHIGGMAAEGEDKAL